MKKVCILLLVCLFLSACAAPEGNGRTTTPADTTSAPATTPATTPAPATDPPVNGMSFLSAPIEEAARAALAMPEGHLSVEIMATVTELTITFDTFEGKSAIWPETLPFPAENPVDIFELSYFPNLESLTLVGMNNGLATLPELTKLSTLRLFWHENIHSTYALDLSPLAKFTALKTLEISAYYPENMAALAPLPLESISLYFSQITDLSPFAALPHLKALKLSNFRGYDDTAFSTDLSPLLDLPVLETLAIGVAGADLTVLAALPKLSALSLILPESADFTFLASMPNLAHLAINSPHVQNLSPEGLPAGLLSLVLLGVETADFPALLPGLECYFFPDGTVSENYGSYPLPYDYNRLSGAPK